LHATKMAIKNHGDQSEFVLNVLKIVKHVKVQINVVSVYQITF